MFHDTQPARLDDQGGLDPWAAFRIDHPAEVHALLRQVRDAAAPVVLAAPGGVSTSCTLWTLDGTSRRIAFSADESTPQLAALLGADEALAVTYLDAVKLQFELDHLLLVRGRAGAALQAAMPTCLYRFQRRESFRVRPAGRHAPKATLRHPSLPEMLLTLRILDLSVGGCALLVPEDVPELRPGLALHGVQVELDAETAFVAALQLHHVASLDGGGRRVGCEWRLPDPIAERALARYVNQTQKHQRQVLS